MQVKKAISVYPMSTLLYRQHAQHAVNIDTMHTIHTDHFLSGNEWIRNNINGLNVLNAQETPKMGFKGSEVQILSPRPKLTINEGTCIVSAFLF